MRFFPTKNWPMWSRIAATSLVAVVVTACGGGGGGGNDSPPASGNNFTLTVNKTGSGVVQSQPVGIDCGTACAADFAANAVVTLSATPSSTATFSGWTGDCSGSASSCVVTMNQARTVGANFAVSTGSSSYTLSVSVSGTGTVSSQPAGINCPAAGCDGSFAANTTVTLSATPGASQSFTGWSGACSGAATTCAVGMSQVRSVQASFAPIVGTVTNAVLSVSLTGSGTVASNPAGINCGSACTASFSINSQVTLTATPAAGQVFSSWGGACSGSVATCSVQMSQARSVQAVFGQAPARAWGSAALLENSDDFNVSGQNQFSDFNGLIAVAPNGDAMAIWEQSDGQPDGSTKKVYSRRYISGSGWQAAVTVPNLTVCSSCASAQGHLILESSGNAVWIQPNSTTRRFSPTTGWSASFAPAELSPDISEPIKAANGDITVIASASSGVFVNTLPSGSNLWGTWLRLDTGTQGARGARLALSANGTALAVWEERNPGDSLYSVKAVRYVPATGWGTPVSIENLFTEVFSRSVRVAIDAQGNGMAMWHQGTSVYYNIFNAASGWQGAVALVGGEPGNSSIANARIDLAMTSNGRAVAVWTAFGSTIASLFSAQYDALTGWSTVAQINDYNVSRSMRLDDSGRAVVVYKPNLVGSLNFDLVSRNLTLGGSWSAATLLEQNAGSVKESKLAMNAAGQAVVIWVQYDIANSDVRNSLWSAVLPQ